MRRCTGGDRDPRRWGKRETIPDNALTMHCHHQNDSCIKMGSNENHFNVSIIVTDSHKDPQTTMSEESGEPKRNRIETLLLTSLTAQAQAKLTNTLTSQIHF